MNDALSRLPSRFVDKINVTPTSCWEWQGALDHKGYARVSWERKNVSAHRLIFTMLSGPIPDGLQLDHLCRNKPCVNPEHLEPVTGAENMRRHVALITHCHKGHPFSGDNLWIQHWRGQSYRRCRTCMRNRGRAAA